MAEGDLKKESEIVLPKTLLGKVTEGLKNDRRVFYAGQLIHPKYGSGWVEAVDILVAPNSAIYDPRRLNEFMDSLLPGLERSARDAAEQYSKDEDFHLGRLYFDELIGLRKSKITEILESSDSDAMARSGLAMGTCQYERNEELKRRTWVRVYPDQALALSVYEYEKALKDGTLEEASRRFQYSEHWLSPEIIEKARKASGRGLNLKQLLNR